MNLVARSAGVVVVLAAIGCGAASERDVHALYASLQVEEARSTSAEHAVLEGPCDERAAACEEACDASRQASSIADHIGERDARVRAEETIRVCLACRDAAPCEVGP